MAGTDRVLIAGAGPAGLVAAANLVRHGVPVTVFEAGSDLSDESRASTFHPPTLDMLERLGAAAPLIAQGLQAPKFQYRSKGQGILGEFDFSALAGVTAHPYRVQCEQSKLTRILLRLLSGQANFDIAFDSRVVDVSQDASGAAVVVEHGARTSTCSGRWLIGADGARSGVRQALGIAFEGFTWPERFLVVSTPFDFAAVIPGLVAVSYVCDAGRWHFLLRIPGLCRVMFPVAADESDELALNPVFAQSLLATVVPGITDFEIAHVTLYKVHQRVATSFHVGRAFLVGDAAHINNPLGGMGMNGGIHDAVNLTERMAEVWHGSKAACELQGYERQRRSVTLEYIQTQTIQNKRNLESDGTAFKRELAGIAADPRRTYDYLLRVSMIASLRRAEELG